MMTNRSPAVNRRPFESDFEIVVEAAGGRTRVRNVLVKRLQCLFAFMPWALPQDVRARAQMDKKRVPLA